MRMFQEGLLDDVTNSNKNGCGITSTHHHSRSERPRVDDCRLGATGGGAREAISTSQRVFVRAGNQICAEGPSDGAISSGRICARDRRCSSNITASSSRNPKRNPPAAAANFVLRTPRMTTFMSISPRALKKPP
jgi:hypothetical protein